MIVSASPIRTYAPQYSDRGQQNAQQQIPQQRIEQPLHNSYKVVRNHSLETRNPSSDQKGLRTIDALAFNHLLSQMGAVESQMSNEPGQLIDVYT